MATCPKCLGALTENHKCPPQLRRRVTDAALTVGIGGAIGALACFAIDERPAGALLMATAALGAVLAYAIRQAINGRPS
jgi:hypothetical protein